MCPGLALPSVLPLHACREDNWAFFLKLHLEWRCEYLGESWNPLKGDQNYRSLRARDKVEILHRLCHWRLELDDIGDLLRVSRGRLGRNPGRLLSLLLLWCAAGYGWA